MLPAERLTTTPFACRSLRRRRPAFTSIRSPTACSSSFTTHRTAGREVSGPRRTQIQIVPSATASHPDRSRRPRLAAEHDRRRMPSSWRATIRFLIPATPARGSFLPSVARDRAGNLQGVFGISGAGVNEHPGLDSVLFNPGTHASSTYGYIANPITSGDAQDTDNLNYRWGDWQSAVLDPSRFLHGLGGRRISRRDSHYRALLVYGDGIASCGQHVRERASTAFEREPELRKPPGRCPEYALGRDDQKQPMRAIEYQCHFDWQQRLHPNQHLPATSNSASRIVLDQCHLYTVSLRSSHRNSDDHRRCQQQSADDRTRRQWKRSDAVFVGNNAGFWQRATQYPKRQPDCDRHEQQPFEHHDQFGIGKRRLHANGQLRRSDSGTRAKLYDHGDVQSVQSLDAWPERSRSTTMRPERHISSR